VKTELGLDTTPGADMELGPDMELDCVPSGGETAVTHTHKGAPPPPCCSSMLLLLRMPHSQR